MICPKHDLTLMRGSGNYMSVCEECAIAKNWDTIMKLKELWARANERRG